MKRHHVPRVVGSGSPFSEHSTAAVTASFRSKKDALLELYREAGIPLPSAIKPSKSPVQAPAAPTPTPEPAATDSVRAEAQQVAARLATNPTDPVARRRAAELATILEKQND